MSTAITDDPAHALESWALVQQVQQGDTETFGQLYDRYADVIFRFIYFRVGDRPLAEDLTSDTFLRALKRIDSFTWQGRDLGTWLITIARNLVADHFKGGHYRYEVTMGDVLDVNREDNGPEGRPESAVVDDMCVDDWRRILAETMKSLPAAQQQCLRLRFFDELPSSEIAVIMGKKVGAVKTLQHRGVRALARLLPDNFDPLNTGAPK